jgi:hypothetical protein
MAFPFEDRCDAIGALASAQSAAEPVLSSN